MAQIPHVVVVAPEAHNLSENAVVGALAAMPEGGKLILLPSQKGAGSIELGFNEDGPYVQLSDSDSSLTLSCSGVVLSEPSPESIKSADIDSGNVIV